MKYYSAIKKNGCESAELRWVNLKPVTQNALCYNKTNSYWKNCCVTQKFSLDKEDVVHKCNGMLFSDKKK